VHLLLLPPLATATPTAASHATAIMEVAKVPRLPTHHPRASNPKQT
jgi:hypothetical protein